MARHRYPQHCAAGLLFTILGCHPPAARPPAPLQSPEAIEVECDSAWWVDAQFTPSDTTIDGLPVQRLDSTWTALLALTRDRMPPSAACDPSDLADSSTTFALDGDFNHDHLPDHMLVGVYRHRDGSGGRFLLILTRHDGSWGVSSLDTIPGPLGFSVLTARSDVIGWWLCMECDVGYFVRWDGNAYVLADAGPD